MHFANVYSRRSTQPLPPNPSNLQIPTRSPPRKRKNSTKWLVLCALEATIRKVTLSTQKNRKRRRDVGLRSGKRGNGSGRRKERGMRRKKRNGRRKRRKGIGLGGERRIG
jgi:hypothetical protein